MKTILTVIGTRPEAIKLAPVLEAINKNKNFINKVCFTRQHTDLLDPFILNLGISADYEFINLKESSSLHQTAAHILTQFSTIFSKSKPDLVIVQGDTSTAFSAALAAFYSHIPVAHIEAGLRTGNLFSPWPEEAHRCLISRLASFFFAPTLIAKHALLSEGVSPDKIWVVGNTSIDALKQVPRLKKSKESLERMIVVTIHRRENHGKPLNEIFHALCTITKEFSDVRIKYILHPNPAVRKPAIETLSKITNIDLEEPKDHPSFLKLLNECTFLITDSGGIQEEAPYFGKPVLITRDTTERPEGVLAGTARLVGTNSSNIIACCKELLQNPHTLAAMSKIHFPYGTGYAAEQIVNILDRKLNEETHEQKNVEAAYDEAYL
jgi:UDP-N-acetylglucosamine 2-epimerase (non-hydrolysing)